LPGVIGQRIQLDEQISARQEARGFFWPFGQFEARAGKDVAKAGVFPFAGIAETVKVEMPDMEVRQFIGLHHGVGGAFDAAGHTQGTQQMAHQGGLACAQVAVQFDKRVAQVGLHRQRLRKKLRGRFVRPEQTFYNGSVTNFSTHINSHHLVSEIQAWARELGFSQIGVAGVDLSSSEAGLSAWLARGFHGDMGYMAAHGLKRARPAELVPGTVSVITVRMDYLPATTPPGWQAIEFARLTRPSEGIVSVYARGRDYHKVLRKRLQHLSDRIAAHVGLFGHRVFTDSAPVLEAELAARSGQGWRGKHTLLLSREAGSMFFLGEIYVDLALPLSEPVLGHCGSCNVCIEVCPTQAIVAPHQLDARRCISYLTIEHAGPIPLELRPLIGNRIYGCDDCQLICPWNKFAQRSALPDFDERKGLAGSQLATLFTWTEDDFLRFTEGSPIRRIGHERWLRNIAVAMGNALRKGPAPELRQALALRADHPSELVREHVAWALAG
jgi:epoxyqueuosine reductase